MSTLSSSCCSSFLHPSATATTTSASASASPSLNFLFLSKHKHTCHFSISTCSQTLLHHIPRSSTSSTPTIQEDPVDDLPLDSESNFNSPSDISGCKACGREEVERGCNGEGRIQGGIATFPGFGWWPIKAYRPCPGFVASGGRYRRTGQSLDEVAFGKGKREASVETDAQDKSRKKKQVRQDKGSEPSNAELGDAMIGR